MTKLVYGIGISDPGQYFSRVDGKHTDEYQLWVRVLQRCQSGGLFQTKQPAYIGCSVHPDFIRFQWFAEWCNNQIGFGLKGWALDKDILIQSNRVYGPDTCCFVPKQLNQLLAHKRSNQGLHPTGVSYFRNRGNYIAQIGIDGKNKTLGYFETPELAEAAYKIAKTNDIRRQAELWKTQIDPRVYVALLKYEV